MTKEELAKLVHVQEEPDGPVTAARIDQWMSYYDLNNDGVVDPQEWAYRVREDRLQQLVANHDADADGQMTEAELLAAGHEAGAVKKFFESGCSSSAFQREAVLLAELRHPNIVQLINCLLYTSPSPRD